MTLVNVILEARFYRSTTGEYFTDSVFSSAFWQRYLNVFSKVNVIARVEQVDTPPVGSKLAGAPKVSFSHLPYYIGPRQYLSLRSRIRKRLVASLDNSGCCIIRAPSQIGWLASRYLARIGRPYAVELVGDPFDTFSKGATRHIFRSFFQQYFLHSTKDLVSGAFAVSYVTSQALQLRYPPAPTAFSTHYSSIDLPSSAIADRPRQFSVRSEGMRLITVGTLEQLYKGQDILLKAVRIARASGHDFNLRVVGDGSYRAYLERLAKDLGVADLVEFVGRIEAGQAIRDLLDESDIFVLASRQEGLPRALIEAMARGLPCLSTRVGGIPELLDADALVDPNDTKALANKLASVANNQTWLDNASRRNLIRASDFEQSILQERRNLFYQEVANKSC